MYAYHLKQAVTGSKNKTSVQYRRYGGLLAIFIFSWKKIDYISAIPYTPQNISSDFPPNFKLQVAYTKIDKVSPIFHVDICKQYRAIFQLYH